MKSKYFLPGVLMMMLFIISSCNKEFLDPRPTDRLAENTVWSSPALIEGAVNRLYNDLNFGMYTQYAFGEDNQILGSITDELASIYEGYEGRVVLVNGQLGPDNVRGHRLNRLGWNEQYLYVSLTNQFLERVELTEVLTPEEKNRLTGEARLLRGFHYFNLLKQFGGAILIDKPFKLGDDYFAVGRSTIEQTISFIVNDINEGISLLPEQAAVRGRVDKNVGRALKAKVLLYAASPLYTEGANDVAKWQAAADAAKELMDGGKYSLELDFEKYRRSFIVNDPASPEIIFAEEHTVLDPPVFGNPQGSPTYGTGTSSAGLNPAVSFGTTGAGGVAYGSPIQQLVDDYEMENGKMINEPGSGYDAQDPYVNRDPRFDAFIWHHGSMLNQRALDTRLGVGFDMQWGVFGNPTGYYMRKFVNEERFNSTATAIINPFTNDPVPWIFFRYAEVLLNYAEAINEAAGPALAYGPINQIRARAGMPALDAGLSQDQMREKIRHERRIELVFEEHRFFDVRRWKIAEQTQNFTVMGANITGDIGSEVYGVAPIAGIDVTTDRVFLPHHYFWPVQRNEILANPEIQQNPGYN